MAVCPVIPATPSCKYLFFPLSDTVHAVATGTNVQTTKIAPRYLGTLPSVADTALVLVCLPPSSLSSDRRRCVGVGGVESSILVVKSALSSSPTGPDYTRITGYLIEQSYDAGASWDSIATTIGYPAQAVAHCFRITAKRQDGTGPPITVCPLPQ
jgi:hypothetical protein